MKTIKQICEKWFYKDTASKDLYLDELTKELGKREKERGPR